MLLAVIVLDASRYDVALLSAAKTFTSCVLVDKVLEFSDFKTSTDESLSTTASLACRSCDSTLILASESSMLETCEPVLFTSLAYIEPTDNAATRTNIKVSNIFLFKIFYLHNKMNILREFNPAH